MKLESVKKENYNGDYDSAVLEQWKTCVEMANNNTEKRSNSNNYYITQTSHIETSQKASLYLNKCHQKKLT